jgi:hypothetical protein
MKKYFYLAALAGALIIAGCGKEKDPAPTTPISIDGYWFGFYKVNGTTTNYNVSLLVRPGGTLRLYALDLKTDTLGLPAFAKVEGTWTLSGNVFEFDCPVGTQHIKGSLSRSADQAKLNGTYGVDGSMTGIMEYKKFH